VIEYEQPGVQSSDYLCVHLLEFGVAAPNSFNLESLHLEGAILSEEAHEPVEISPACVIAVTGGKLVDSLAVREFNQNRLALPIPSCLVFIKRSTAEMESTFPSRLRAWTWAL
jgi:hypothetical protein